MLLIIYLTCLPISIFLTMIFYKKMRNVYGGIKNFKLIAFVLLCFLFLLLLIGLPTLVVNIILNLA